MKIKDIQNVIELLKLANFNEKGEEVKDFEKDELNINQISLPSKFEDIFPLISIDGSYCMLFSFLGMDTWVALFRIGITEYRIELIGDKIHYIMKSPPKVLDHLNLLSFNQSILNSQPEVFSKVADIVSAFQERNPGLFASNIMSYLEDNTLEEISKTARNSIILKDGALLTYKALERDPIYKNIILNCRTNNNMLAGISKSSTTHFFASNYTDDYFLKKYYDEKYQDLTYIQVPEESIKKQTKFDIWSLGTYFSKLHKKTLKWFRIDIGHDNGDINKLFSSLAAYSKVQLMPGYPVGLIEAHKVAKSVRDLKKTYETELIEPLKVFGLTSQDILHGIVDVNGRELYSFHEMLDQLSR
ncbi:MAG: hypothetical protein KAT57_11675 [Candidatus Lokiarchaeota archaeon]|nr:hypothetical protein [Candidatus Lokiarchaeota archaeon]